MTRFRPYNVIAALFVLTRVAFLAWFINGSSLYLGCDCSVREVSACGDGTWLDSARQIAAGETPTHHDDMGVPYLIAKLNNLGVPFTAGYWIVIAGFHLAGLLLLLLLYRRIEDLGPARWQALVAVCALVLYPPGLYLSFCNIVRMLSVYGFLLVAVIYIYRERLFSGLTVENFFLLTCLSLALITLNYVRSSNRLLGVGLVLALGVYAVRSRAARVPLAVFALLLLGWSAAFRPLLPRAEHVFWHPMFVYLGDFDRKYGIEATDEYGVRSAMAANPRLATETDRYRQPGDVVTHPDYEPTLKRLYLEKIKGDPVWFARILTLRAVKLFVLPFHGSWAPPLSHLQEDLQVRLGDLASSTRLLKYRLYITAGTSSIILDMFLVFTGFIGILIAIRSAGWAQTLAWAILLGTCLYSYVLVGTQDRTVYLAGTYFYLFMAIRLLMSVPSFLGRNSYD